MRVEDYDTEARAYIDRGYWPKWDLLSCMAATDCWCAACNPIPAWMSPSILWGFVREPARCPDCLGLTCPRAKSHDCMCPGIEPEPEPA